MGIGYSFISDFLFFELNLNKMQIVGLVITLLSTVLVAVYKMFGTKLEESADDDSFVVAEEINKLGKPTFSIVRIDSSESLNV